jgi:hypothetical protein
MRTLKIGSGELRCSAHRRGKLSGYRTEGRMM